MDDTLLSAIYNYWRLSARLACAGQPTEDELAAVARAGFEVVINLGLPDADYALPDEPSLVRSLGLDYICIPVVWERPTDADLDRFLEAMQGLRDRKVFVHCAANMRASVFIALYRVIVLGWPAAHALQEVRRIWEPDEVWQGFIDASLVRYGLGL